MDKCAIIIKTTMGDSRGITCLNLEGNIAENWKLWRSRFENYIIASEINKKDEKTQCAQLLHYIGEEGFKIYTTFQFKDDEKNKLEILLGKFENHFLPKENLSYERYKFFSYKQQLNQTLEQFITELRKRAMKCNLGELQDSLIKTMIVCGVNSATIRERLLQDDSLSLDKAVELAMVIETTKERSEIMEKARDTTIAAVMKKDWRKSNQEKGNTTADKKIINNCKRCGKNHPVNRCPAFGKMCNLCKNKNHFAVMCKRKKNVNIIDDCIDNIHTNDVNDYFFINNIESNKNNNEEWVTNLVINGENIKFKIDTGAMVNVLPLSIYNKLGYSLRHISKTNVVLKSYTGSNLDVLGVCKLLCYKNNNSSYKLEFFVVKSNSLAILGLPSCKNLNLVMKVEAIDKYLDKNSNTLVKEFSDLFSGVGCLPEPYCIQLEDNAKPVVHATRRVPVPLMKPLKECLDELVKANIIKKVVGVSDWVNALVLVRKADGKLRICLDPKDLNNAIKREYCQIPTINEITSKMKGAKFFSTLDATNGFYHIALDENSTKLCTFGTPYGRYKFLRLPFGIKVAPEVFHERFKTIFNVEGCEVYIDDLVMGYDAKRT